MILRRRRGNPEIFANLTGNAGARGGIFDKNVSSERYRISVFAAAENKARIDKIFRLGKITFFVKFAVIRKRGLRNQRKDFSAADRRRAVIKFAALFYRQTDKKQ